MNWEDVPYLTQSYYDIEFLLHEIAAYKTETNNNRRKLKIKQKFTQQLLGEHKAWVVVLNKLK